MKIKKEDLFFYLSLVCAIWFALTSGLWTYFANVVLSLPFGILSLILWIVGRERDSMKARYRFVPIILTVGLIIAIVSLIYIS